MFKQTSSTPKLIKSRHWRKKKKSRWLAQLFTELTLHFYFVYCLRNLSPFLSRRLTSVTITEQKLPYITDLYSLSWLYQSYHIGYESCIVNSLYVQLISKLLLTGVAFHKHTSIIWMKTRDDILRFERKKEKGRKGRQEIISFSITENLCRIFFLSPLFNAVFIYWREISFSLNVYICCRWEGKYYDIVLCNAFWSETRVNEKELSSEADLIVDYHID